MSKITHVKPTLPVETYLEIAKLLEKVGGQKLAHVGSLMLATYKANMLEPVKTPATYEESDSMGSPESYNAPDKCEPGVCD
tara:strand:+ start:3757 stop:3999 length:243 start_codon:yes stop_codon:yes gene_type:complete